MPDFEVTSPSGQRFIVTAPQGASQDQILSYAKQNMPAAAPPENASSGRPPTPGPREMAGREPGEDILGTQQRPARDAETIFNERKALEQQLRSQGATDLRQSPQWANLTRELSVAQSNKGREAAGFLAPAGGGIAKLIPRGIEGIAGLAKGAATALREPATAKGAATALREEAVQTAGKTAQTEEKTAQTEGTKALAAQAEMERNAASATEHLNALRQEYQKAGMNPQDTQRLVAQSARQMQDTEMAVSQLEKDVTEHPGMTADEFGQRLRNVTQGIADKYAKIRSVQSGYDEALNSAGAMPRVDTAPAQAVISHHLEDIRNPPLKRVLDQFQGLLKTEDVDRLNVRSADSARKYLDRVIRAREVEGVKIDAESVHILKQVKKSLVQSATQAWPPYRDALARWNILSRPLDIVEGKAGLRKVIAKEPDHAEYALAEAQVVKEIMSKGRAGNKVLTRLMSESPDIKEAARLYFTQDLYSAPPSLARLRTWLKTNESPLKQLGLYDEFKDLRVARETARRAVAEAKGEYQTAQQRAAEIRAAQKQMVEANRARKLAMGQPIQPTAEEIADSAKSRAIEQGKEVLEQKVTATAAQKKAMEAAKDFRTFETEIKTVPPEKVAAKVQQMAKRLVDEGRITQAKYEEARRRVEAVDKKFKDAAVRKRRLISVAKWTALAAGTGYVGYHAVGDILR